MSNLVEQVPGAGAGGLGRKLVNNTLLNLVGQLYVVVLSLAVVPYVIHRLGADLYGMVMLVLALGGFAGLLNLGMGRTLAKYVSELYWQGDFGRIRALFQTSFSVSLLAGAVAVLAFIVFRAPLAAALFHGNQSTDQFVSYALIVTAVGVLISLVSDPLSALPIAVQRFDIANWMNILSATLSNAGAILALACGFFVKGVLVAWVIADVLVLAAYAFYARKLLPNLSLRPQFKWQDFKYMAHFSASVVLTGISAFAVIRLDRVLVAYFLPIAAVAFYVVPYSLAEKTPIGVANITSVILPAASELSTMGAGEKLRELYLRSTKMAALAGFPVTVILLGAPSQILNYWVGPEFARKGALTLQLLAAGYLFNMLAQVPAVIVQGVGRPWILTKYSLWNGVANVACFLVLIPRYGIAGAAMGFFASEVVVMSLFIWETNHLFQVSWPTLFLRSYLQPAACAALALAAMWLCSPHASSRMTFALACGFALGLYGLAGLAIALDHRERTDLYSQVLSTLRFQRSVANV